MLCLTLLLVLAALLLTNVESFGLSSNSFIRKSSPVIQRNSRQYMQMRWGLKGAPSNKPTGDLPEGVTLRDTVPFELRGFSLPLVVFSIGILLTAFSFAGFFLNDGGGEGALSSLGFVYGIPVFLIGLSLWYAEIKPVPVISDATGDKIWEELATDTFKKIKQDVTRHRYGDDAHLDTTLEALGLKLPQKKYPKLLSLKQAATTNGELEFTMQFQSAETPYKLWADPQRVARYEKYFGPDVRAEVYKVDPDQRILALRLTTTFQGRPEPVAPVAQPASEATTTTSDANETF